MPFSRDTLQVLESAVEQMKDRYHYRLYTDSAEEEESNTDGGPGSGNWGHRGVPGMRGGSAPGGGKQNRHVIPGSTRAQPAYTSWSKQRDAVAKPHKATKDELKQLPQGTIIKRQDGSAYVKKNDDWFLQVRDKSGKAPSQLDADDLDGEEIRAAAPKSANPNFQREGDTYSFQDIQDDMDFAPRYGTQAQADKALRNSAGQAWQSLSKEEKTAVYGYTAGGSSSVNRELRSGNVKPSTQKAVEQLSSAMSKSHLPSCWLQRGVSVETAEKMLGLPQGALLQMDTDSIRGLTGVDHGFMSCGSTEKTGSPDMPVQFHIYCPAGTQGMYVEPVSKNGAGPGREWDGKQGQNTYSSDMETVLNRDTAIETTRIWVEDGVYHIESMVVGQGGVK